MEELYLMRSKQKHEELREIFILTDRHNIREYYDGLDSPSSNIGEGSFGKVVKVTHKETKVIRACKIIPKSHIKHKNLFRSEVQILRDVDHPHIIKLYEEFEDEKFVYLVQELCTGGELFDRIVKSGFFKEKEARNVFIQIITSIFYLHKQGICHRDIKPENFLYFRDSRDSPIKMIDFGLSKKFMGINKNSHHQNSRKDHGRLTTMVGTSYYIAPEVLEGDYDEKCDIWSAGVILYILLCGFPPFNGDNDYQIFQEVKALRYDFPSPEWDKISDSAKALIKKMMCKAEHRFSAEQVIQSEWVKFDETIEELPLELNLISMKSYIKSSKLRKVVLTYIATQLSSEEISRIGDEFRRMDTNGDGVLSYDEIKVGLEKMNFSPEDVQSLLDNLELNEDGVVDYTKFVAANMEKSVYLREERLMAAFKLFDKDGDGKITVKEIMEVLNREQCRDEDYYNQLLKEVDLNGDGTIDFNEFLVMMVGSK
jgi:calcium-dependent protein kinase